MGTREVLAKINTNIRFHIEELRKQYHREGANKDVARTASSQYVLGLRDAGMITERERQILFVYTTV